MKRSFVFVLGVTCLLASEYTARADVSAFSASAASSIVQYQNNVEQQRDDRSLTYPGSGSVLPVEVSHTLTGRNSDGQVNWTAFNRVLTNDPQYNSDIPTDFITETAIGSAANDVSLKVTSQARQARRINLLNSEFPGVATGTPVNLKSQFTLDGALAAIVPSGTTSSEGLQVKCNLKITKDTASIWDGTVQMAGKADGTFDVTTSGNLKDSDFVSTHNNVPDLASIWIVAFADAALPFSYQGNVGDSFDLAAELNLEYIVPGGLGAGSAFGTVPSEMITVTNDLFGPAAQAYTAKSVSYAPAPEPATLLVLLTGTFLSVSRRQNRR